MTDPFSSYGLDVGLGVVANERAKPKPLTGVIKTRAAARKIYGDIVSNLNACEDRDTLDIYLITIGEELVQFEHELEFLWKGSADEDFAGLEAEIRVALERLPHEFRH